MYSAGIRLNSPIEKMNCEDKGSGKSEAAEQKTTNGRRGRTRTCNRRIRNPMLYPFELRARVMQSF